MFFVYAQVGRGERRLGGRYFVHNFVSSLDNTASIACGRFLIMLRNIIPRCRPSPRPPRAICFGAARLVRTKILLRLHAFPTFPCAHHIVFQYAIQDSVISVIFEKCVDISAPVPCDFFFFLSEEFLFEQTNTAFLVRWSLSASSRCNSPDSFLRVFRFSAKKFIQILS